MSLTRWAVWKHKNRLLTSFWTQVGGNGWFKETGNPNVFPKFLLSLFCSWEMQFYFYPGKSVQGRLKPAITNIVTRAVQQATVPTGALMCLEGRQMPSLEAKRWVLMSLKGGRAVAATKQAVTVWVTVWILFFFLISERTEYLATRQCFKKQEVEISGTSWYCYYHSTSKHKGAKVCNLVKCQSPFVNNERNALSNE